MKAKLTFDLDQPDDREAHLRCVKSLDIALALHSIRECYYKMLTDEDQEYAFADFAAELNGIMLEYNIELEELIS